MMQMAAPSSSAGAHQFRFFVVPEDAAEMHDLRGFTRDQC
jgi:type IV secretory pathway VirD2 relaxase